MDPQVCGKQYASKWKAFDHTKKCHGKVFRTCKQCLAVFTSDEDLRYHYEHIHNIPKDQLDAYQYRLEVSGNKMDDYDLGPLGPEVVVKEEPEELDFDCSVEGFDDESSDSKRRRSLTDTFDCEICPEMFLNHEQLSQHYRNVHNTDPDRMFKRLKLEQQQQQQQPHTSDEELEPGKAKLKKMRDRENYECKNCQKQFCTKTLYLGHVSVCTRKSMPTTSILEAHLKNNNSHQQVKREPIEEPPEQPEEQPVLCETNLNIPDFNLFEDINMQLSGQKPVPSLMPLSGGQTSSASSSIVHHPNSKSSKYSRKDSRKVYDESTNTECACEVCGKQWPAKKHLWQHLIRFHRAEAAVTCGVCLKLCSTYEALSEHLKHAHPAILSAVGNNFTCKVCGRYHNARSKLLLHMSIHINCKSNLICGRCNRSFETDDRLKEHVAECLGAKDDEPMMPEEEELIIKDEEKGSLIGDEEEEEEAEENEYESEDNDSNSSSSDSDSSSSSSDDSDDSSNSDDSDTESQPQEVIQQPSAHNASSGVGAVAVKHEMLQQEHESLSDDDEDEEDEEEDSDEAEEVVVPKHQQRYEAAGLSESEDDEYQLKQPKAEHELEDQYHEMPDKDAILNYSEDEDVAPGMSPMMPMAMKEEVMDSDELRRHRVGLGVQEKSALSESSDEESEDERINRAQVVDPNAALHADNTTSSNEGAFVGDGRSRL